MSGKIPQAFIDDLLARVDIVDIIDGRVKLKKTGRNYSACCPFHKEKSPSFSVSPDKQFYYCFGCGASGNAIGFVMEHDHLSFPETVNLLAGQQGLDVPRETNLHAHREPDYSELYQLTADAVTFYQQQLASHAQSARATQYLMQRGLDSNICQQFSIGFAPPGWDNLKTALAATTEKEKQLLTTGILVENEDKQTVYDRFRDRIIFPIRDSRGRFIAFGGRVLGNEKPKYLNSPESPIFHKGRELYGLYEAKQANRTLKQVLVVEGYMDVVALAQHGINYAVATLGTATTLDHMQRLFKVTQEVIFCFDGDDAGRRAAWRALESTLPVMEDGRQARFLFLPQGEDPDSLVRQEGAEQFSLRMREQALSFDHFLFKELESGLDLHTMDGRARLAKLTQPYLVKLPNGLFRQLLLKQLADRTGLEVRYLEEHFSEQQSQHGQAEPVSQPLKTNAQPPQKQASLMQPFGAMSGHNPIAPAIPHQQSQKVPQQRDYYQSTPAPSVISMMSKSSYALRHLLCDPTLAQAVSIPLEKLMRREDTNNDLLLTVLSLLKQTPTLTTTNIIARWYGTEIGRRLFTLANIDSGNTASRAAFLDALQRLQEDDSNILEYKNHIQDLQNKKVTQLNDEQRSMLLTQFHKLRAQKLSTKEPVNEKK